MRVTILLPFLAATSTTLALPLAHPQDVALLGMCLTGHKHCKDGPGLFSSLFASGPGAAADNKALIRRAEAGTELGVGSLLGNLPLLSSLVGMGEQTKGQTPGDSSGNGGGGLGGLGLKERRGEEAGVGDLFSSLPLLGSLLGGGKGNGSPSTANPMAAGMAMEPSGRKQHLGGSIGI